MRTLIVAALLVLLSAPAFAQSQRTAFSNQYNATVGEADGTIGYFDATFQGRTTTYSDRQEVWNIIVSNETTAAITIRIYWRAAPGYDGTFSALWDDDYTTFTIGAAKVLSLTDLMVPVVGWHIEDNTFTGTGPVVRLYGWN